MFTPINVPPGVIKVDAEYAATGRWVDTDKVRFVRGLPEKVGGVQKLVPGTYTGIVRGSEAWNTFAGVQCLVFGTACNLYILRQGTISEITPYRTDATGISLTDPFETTSGSAVVVVNDTGHGIEASGVDVVFSGASAVGGITIDGEYAVTSIIDADSYRITHTSNATSTTTGGGSVTASYELNCGNAQPGYLLGWGVGLWGEGYWGTDVTLSSAIISEPLTWSLSPYGEDLICNPANGGIYIYDSSVGVQRPTLISNAPTETRFSFVTAERYIFALGCATLSGAQDNMTVRWPDIEDYTDWTPSATNTANQRKLQGGTRLIAGTALTDGTALVWSDSSCFLFQYTGSSEVYASRQVATNCGLIGPLAFTKINGLAIWMGDGDFWMYSGFVQPIPNGEDVKDWVFRNISQEDIYKSVVAYNPQFNEVWFFFPTESGGEPDTYVMVNLDNYAWANGTWERTSAAQFWTGERRPILFGSDGRIYVHDVVENPDNDGAAMEAFIEMAPVDIDRGNVTMDVFGFVPNFQRLTGELTVYLYGRDHPQDGDFMNDTVTVSNDRETLVDTRLAGRQIGMKITSNTLGGDFRLGRMGLEVSPTGGTQR